MIPFRCIRRYDTCALYVFVHARRRHSSLHRRKGLAAHPSAGGRRVRRPGIAAPGTAWRTSAASPQAAPITPSALRSRRSPPQTQRRLEQQKRMRALPAGAPWVHRPRHYSTAAGTAVPCPDSCGPCPRVPTRWHLLQAVRAASSPNQRLSESQAARRSGEGRGNFSAASKA